MIKIIDAIIIIGFIVFLFYYLLTKTLPDFFHLHLHLHLP